MDKNGAWKMYMHRFCKVVTSVVSVCSRTVSMYMHRFCKVVTSDELDDLVRLEMYMHRFCKVVTSEIHTAVAVVLKNHGDGSADPFYQSYSEA